VSQKAPSRSLAEAVGAFEADRRQLIEALRGQLEQFRRYYGLTDRAASGLRSSLDRAIRRAYPAEFNAFLERAVGPITHLWRGLPPMSLDERASFYRVRQITVRDLLREQLESGAELSDEMTQMLGLTTAELSRQVGPTTEADLAKREQFTRAAMWEALPRREREAARLFARRVEKHGPGVGAGRPRYAGETTVFEVAFAIRDALAASGHRLSDRRLIPFNKAGSSLKGQPVSLLRAAVLAALPVRGLPSDRYLEDLLTRHR
jgi:hypothetical protein